jgi:hypothetical protein
MPDSSSVSGESDVELMAIVYRSQTHRTDKVCFDSRVFRHVLIDKYGIGQNLQLHSA